MSVAAHRAPSSTTRIANKAWREVSRPFRRIARRLHQSPVGASQVNATPPQFDVRLATVEPEGIALLQRLVRAAGSFPGPIIEIGTLLGVTTTTMALAKSPDQRIITVDKYCWNPWGLTCDAHEAAAAEMLRYLVQTGHVERISMDKEEFFRTYAGPAPSLVFLDAMHDYENTKRDIEWAKSVKARLISGHDYSDEFPGVVQIVREMGGPRELGGTVWTL